MAFARAVGWGSFAGAAPYFLISLPIGIATLFSDNAGSEWWLGFYVIVLPLLITLPVVFAASVVFGLPLTALLSRNGWEKGQHYLAAGLFFGTVPLFILFAEIPSVAGMLCVGGALGGAVTGWVWGRHRDELAADRTSE